MNLTSVGDTDLSPLGVLERTELKDQVLDGTGRVELAGEWMVPTSAGRATAWVVFVRHRLTCLGGADPAVCGCETEPDAYHVYLAEPGTDGAVPVRPEPIPRRQCVDCPTYRTEQAGG